VNEYKSDEPAEIPILQMDPEGEKRHLERLRRVKGERDADRAMEALRRLEEASKDSRENTMPYILDAVNAHVTSGEICNMWRRVYGEHKESVVV
jgi:methylmalonyl-CoA mutase, N-terminal domain